MKTINTTASTATTAQFTSTATPSPDFADTLQTTAVGGFWEQSGLLGILTRCCAAFGVTVADAQSRARTEQVVFARQAYCYLAYRQTSQSTAVIGQLIGRDHSTVSHSVKATENYIGINYRRFTDIYNLLLVD